MLKTDCGLLRQLPPQKLNLLLGEILSLLMVSRLHRDYPVRDVADVILPAVNLNQFILYRNAEKAPVALVTWGRLSAEVEARYLGGDALLSEADLTSGDRLYFMEFIAPYGHARRIVQELRTTIFKDDCANALHVVPGRQRGKVVTYQGVNYKIAKM